MRGKVVLFIVEGPSDQDALIPFLEQKFLETDKKVSVKVMHGDILTEYQNFTRQYKVIPQNVKQELRESILSFLSTQYVKAQQVKGNDICDIYYVTDTDYCFTLSFPHSKNKSNCLSTIFNFETLEIIKGKEIPFKVIFFSKNLEHVVTGEERDFSDLEKKNNAVSFGIKSIEIDGFFLNTFLHSSIKTWASYRESYNGIKTYQGKSCNMNNLLDELFIK